MFALQHHPVQILENGSLAVADGHVFEHNHQLGDGGKRRFPLHLDRMRTMLDQEIGLDLDLRNEAEVLDFDDACDKIRYLVHLRKHQDDLHTLFFRQYSEELLHLVSGLCVESDKRVLDDQHPGFGKQIGGELEFAQLTTRQQYDILVKQIIKMEELIDMLLEIPSLRCVLTGQQECLFKLTANGGCLFINLHLVPALLQEIGAVIVAAVGIAEGDVLDVVIGLIKGVFHHTREHGVTAGDHVY